MGSESLVSLSEASWVAFLIYVKVPYFPKFIKFMQSFFNAEILLALYFPGSSIPRNRCILF